MKKFYSSLISALVLCLLLMLSSCSEPAKENHKKKYDMEEEEEGGDRRDHMEQAEAFEFERTKDPRLGYVPRQHLLQAFQQVKTARPNINQRVDGAITGVMWNERGPNNVGGRTRSILVDKNDPSGNTIWVGSVGGGLWKATNFTTASYTWHPINDIFPNLAITAIVQNPSNPNTMYFGTGEGFGNSDALQGGGVWKSTDGGANWSQVAATNVTGPTSTFSHIQKMLVKQVGGVEYLFVATRNAGIQRSTDGGASFTQVNTIATSLRAADLELAQNGDIFAGMGLSGSGDGVYRSTNNGDTWTKCVTGLPATGIGRVEVAVAPNNAAVLYATFQSSANSRALGIYKSADNGTTWTTLTNANAGQWASSQAWYDLIMAVDPDDANHVVIGGLDCYATTDGGTTWTAISSWFGGAPQYIHADHHALQFYKTPSNQTFLYFGNDGGIFFTANASSASIVPTVLEKNDGYNVTQFYHGSIGPVPGSNQLIAGAQDNGTQYYTAAGINATTEVTGGDGAFSHIDDDNPNVQISQYVYNQYRVTNDNWASYTNVNFSSSAGRFINPSDYDSRTNTLYGAYNSASYTIITNIGTTNNAATKTVTGGLGATASAVCVSPNTVARVYFGTSSGRIVRVDSANSAAPVATNITATVPVVGYISEIAVQEGDDNHIIYAISSYGVNSIWETKNGGTTWASIEGNFTQDVPVRAIMFSPNSNTQAFIGTDIGVYSTDNLNGTSTDWAETNAGLARVSVQHLEYRRGTGTLLAVTHGRGVYTSTSLEGPAVYFANGSVQYTETNSSTIGGCRKFTDVQVPVVLSAAPSAPVQVNITTNATLTTATPGQDYEVITPMPMTFSAAGTQNIVVRVYDDANIESTETAVLEIAIANPTGTNAKKGAGYLGFISLLDNDLTPEVAGPSLTMYSEDWENGIGSWQGFGGATATAPNVWGLTNSCSNTINNQTAGINNGSANTCGYDNTKPTTAVIYQTINAAGKTNLSIEFDWKGVGEVGYDQGEVVFDTTTSATPTWRVLSGATSLSGNPGIIHKAAVFPAQIANHSFRVGFRWTNDDNTGDNPAFAVDNIKIISKLAAPVQLAVDPTTAFTNFVGANETVPFYDNNGNILGILKNNNALTLGCVKLEVDRAGGGDNVAFWSTNPVNFLAAKTYKITAPDAPVTGVSYDITLYYTAAEIAKWKAQTTLTENDAKIVKITGHSISEVTPSNQLASSVTVASTVAVSSYSDGDYAFRATFNSFSGFGLGSPGQVILPITSLNLKGILTGDKGVLSWTTKTETNNKGFYVEKSTNGTTFSPVTFITGAGTSSAPHSYSYTDAGLAKGIFYYRLKQVDVDGRISYSNIVVLQVAKDGIVQVYPNPVRNTLYLLFGQAVTLANAQMFSSGGSKVLSRTLTLNGQSATSLDISNLNLPKGIYILRLVYDGKVKEVKVMKE